MPKPASTRPAYKMLTCIYLCRTLLFFAPYADFLYKNNQIISTNSDKPSIEVKRGKILNSNDSISQKGSIQFESIK